MFASSTSGQFLEVVPVVDDLVAACPALLKVMENRLAWMEVAGSFDIVNLIVVLKAAVPFASFFPFFLHSKQQFKAYI